MDFNKELQRINQIINDMAIEDFEKMLFDCGLGTIKPSEESDYVKCLNMNFFDNDYVLKNHGFLQSNYQQFNEFYFDGQEVA